ncbi:MAG: LemA family protein, partial [Bacilli bacterium]|nr:LemA family protein [Bacilli bacterium]
MYYIIFGIIIFILLVFILEVAFYNRFQVAKIRISEAENNIDILLQKKLVLLERVIKVIEEADPKYKEDQILINVIKLKNKKVNNFELNEELDKALAEYKGLLDLDSKLGNIESLTNINYDLTNVDNDLIAAKKFYNRTIVSYNKLVQCFPSNLVGSFFKYKRKEFYSEESEEVYEIL